jgi:hypothetical protein
LSRVFVGVAPKGSDKGEVYVEQNGTRHRLMRRTNGRPVGYTWGQAGPDSIELARVLLWLVAGVEPPWGLYRGFTSDVVARLPLPPCHAECWRLSEAEIRAWLSEVGWLKATTASGALLSEPLF